MCEKVSMIRLGKKLVSDVGVRRPGMTGMTECHVRLEVRYDRRHVGDVCRTLRTAAHFCGCSLVV